MQNSLRSLFCLGGIFIWIIGYIKVRTFLRCHISLFLSDQRSFQFSHVSGREYFIPRRAHAGFSQLIGKIFIFLRAAEVLFADELWGPDARKVLDNQVFWRRDGEAVGKVAGHLSSALGKATGASLGAELRMSSLPF